MSNISTDKRKKILNILQKIKDEYSNCITHIHKIDAKEAAYAPMPVDLSPSLANALKFAGINFLYTHQLESYYYIKENKNVVLTTPTSSGKTLCYNLPILDSIAKNKDTRAIYIFPTKSLSQDQLANLQSIIKNMGEDIPTYTYDGDTPEDARKAIRDKANIVITNPDMRHSGILPHHTKWIKLFENLKYIVIDELHAYRGVFGSHFANVLMRLSRICSFYGSSPQFISTSATIANAKEFAEKLIQQPVHIINKNGAPQSDKYFIFYNPPFYDEVLGIRHSFVKETEKIASILIKNDIKTIIFAPSRLITEIILSHLKEKFEKNIQDIDSIRGYRGGYLPSKRRNIEKELRDGIVKCVVSTNALELGIDVGSLDAVIIASYPGTIASTWQQAGRAGRRDTPSLIFLIASNRSVDQYFISNSTELISATPEHALLNPDNLHILVDHIKCSSFELPFSKNENLGKETTPIILNFLKEDGFVHLSKEKYHWIHQSYPANAISLRSISSDNFVVVDTTQKNKVIAEVDFSSALTTIHPKAIYLLEGKQYYVEKLDFEGRKAYVKQINSDYFTDAICYTEVSILDCFNKQSLINAKKAFGEVKVYQQVVGFKKIKFFTLENVGSGDLALPEYRMHTTSYWIILDHDFISKLPFSNEQKADALRGIAYALHSMATIILMCDTKDIGISISDPFKSTPAMHFDPHIFIYEKYPGGIGLSQPLYEKHDLLIKKAKELIQNCKCKYGCPSCISPAATEGNIVKKLCSEILNSISTPEQ